MAMEEDDEKQMVNAVRQIVNNCTFIELDIDNLPMFDLEYIFLNIRAKSVGEVAPVKLLCKDDGKTYADVDIPLDKVSVHFQEGHTNIIDLDGTVKIEMSYPTFEMAELISKGDVDSVFNLINRCVNRIVDGETIHERIDFTEEELETFLNSLSPQQFADVQKFFDTMPKLQHKVKFTNPKTKKKNTVTLEGLQSFFA